MSHFIHYFINFTIICLNSIYLFLKYLQYIKEIDRKGLLNIGDYNFKKTEELSTLNKFESQVGYIINADNAYSENGLYMHEREEHYKVKKSGIFSAIKRFFGFSGGWLEKTKKKTMVEIKSLIKDAKFFCFFKVVITNI